MYSQHDEERAILEHFGHTPTGLFLDIGAYDGTNLSNTKALEELGWTGVFVECSPSPLAQLLKTHGGKQHTIIGAAIGNGSPMVFHDSGGDAVSSLDAQHAEKWAQAASFRTMIVPTITPATLHSMLVGLGRDKPDFVSVDIEGQSCELAITLYDLGIRPRLWCIEKDHEWQSKIRKLLLQGQLIHSTNENVLIADA